MDEQGIAARDAVVSATRRWLETAVIGLNLCPFAHEVHIGGRIRWVVSEACTEEDLVVDLGRELRLLASAPLEQIETTLLIHPHVLQSFADFNEFITRAEDEVAAAGLTGVLQIATFHPGYQFAGTAPDDITNYTNRSPHPILHLLRETSIDRAVAALPDAGKIVEANLATMRRLGHAGWRGLLGG